MSNQKGTSKVSVKASVKKKKDRKETNTEVRKHKKVGTKNL